MKIKLAVSDESYEEVKNFLLQKGIEFDDDSPFLLTETDKYLGFIAVTQPPDKKLHIKCSDIIYIESFGHSVEVHTLQETYQTKDRLYQLCTLLNPKEFLRVSNSVIISKSKVKKIIPTFSMKFTLVMENDIKLDVTRTYYNIFKESFGI